MKLIRVLEYEGASETLRAHLQNRGVKGIAPVWGGGMTARVRITERFVLPDPLPEWWDEVVPATDENDPTAEPGTE